MLLQEIRLQSNYLSALYNFYHGILKLEVTEADNGGILIAAGRSQLIIEQAIFHTKPFYHFAFNIPSSKIEEAFDWLQNRVEVLWIDDYKSYIADFTGWHAKSVYFFDPAGNIVEFIARHDLHDSTNEPFSSKQLRNISEIGIVYPSAEYDDCVNRLLEKYQLAYFQKQPPMPQFRAIGDDEGLFIVVPESRNWYPTNIPSGIFPLAVKFTDELGEQRQINFR